MSIGRQPSSSAYERSRRGRSPRVELEVDERARPHGRYEPIVVRLEGDRRLVAAVADVLLEAREGRDLGQRVAVALDLARWTKVTPSSRRKVA